MDAAKETLINAYKTQSAEQDEYEEKITTIKQRKRAIAKELFDKFGRGPHDVGDGEQYFVTVRSVGEEAQHTLGKQPKGRQKKEQPAV